MQGFKITQGKGFQITFENGYTVSVQFGVHNYCERQKLSSTYLTEMGEEFWESKNAEIAVIDPDGNFLQITPCDTVDGHKEPHEVAELIYMVSQNDFSFVCEKMQY